MGDNESPNESKPLAAAPQAPTPLVEELPDALSQASVDLDSLNLPPIAESDEFPLPGSDRASSFKPINALVVIVLIITIGAFVVWLAGQTQRGTIQKLLQAQAIPPTARLLDSRHDTVLILEESGEISRVIVQRPSQPSWLLVSRDDLRAKFPALSPDGRRVAYNSQSNDGRIVIVSLDVNNVDSLPTDQIKAATESKNLGPMTLCAWSPVAWSPDNQRLAFFVCGTNPSRSMVMTNSMGQPGIDVVAGTLLNTALPRGVLWLQSDTVLVSTPSESPQGGTTITTHPIP
jgi:hypothetical protein